MPFKCCETRWKDWVALGKHIAAEPNHIFVCGACSVVFGTKKNFRRHMRRRHKPGALYPQLQTDPTAFCGACWRQFDSESDYNRHNRKTHDGWCFICSKDCGSAKGLQQHENSPVHLKPTIHCPQHPKCTKLFKTTGGVASHLESGKCSPITQELLVEAVLCWDLDNIITQGTPSLHNPTISALPTKDSSRYPDKSKILANQRSSETSASAMANNTPFASTSRPQSISARESETGSFDDLECSLSELSDSEVVVSDYAGSEVFLSDASISDFELLESGARTPTYSTISDGELVVAPQRTMSMSSISSTLSTKLSLVQRTPERPTSQPRLPRISREFQNRFWSQPPPASLELFHCPKCKKPYPYISALVQHIESGSCGLASMRAVQEIYRGLADHFKYLLTV